MRECAHCSQAFYAPKHRSGKFCSVGCYQKSRANNSEVHCAICGIPIVRRVRHIANTKTGRFFCSSHGSKGHTGFNGMRTCEYCDQPVTGHGLRFCSPSHSAAFKSKQLLDQWLSGTEFKGTLGNVPVFVRRYMIALHNESCEQCGWHERNPVTGNVPLQIDHADGNCFNNAISNLRVLCPNCHSLTPNFGSLNKGSGRAHRRKPVINVPLAQQ